MFLASFVFLAALVNDFLTLGTVSKLPLPSGRVVVNGGLALGTVSKLPLVSTCVVVFLAALVNGFLGLA